MWPWSASRDEGQGCDSPYKRVILLGKENRRAAWLGKSKNGVRESLIMHQIISSVHFNFHKDDVLPHSEDGESEKE